MIKFKKKREKCYVVRFISVRKIVPNTTIRKP